LIRRLLPTLLVALGLLVLPASSNAKVKVALGVGDQSPKMFEDANWKALGLKKTRYFIHWDAALKPAELAKADAFVDAANTAGVKVLIHLSTENLSAYKAKLPSVNAYKVAANLLVTHFKPKGVTDWGAWNEANHKTQPTWDNAKRAAQFYKTLKGLCSGCTIVALDVLDQKGVEGYIKKWFAAAGSSGKSAKIFGIHNYSQVNRRIEEKGKGSRKASAKYPGTERIIKAVRKSNKKAKFWYTETGGLVNFGGAFKCDPKRAADRTKFMFALTKKFDKDIDRLYSYNWFGTTDCETFDAGLVDNDGTPRPAYAVFKSNVKNYGK
jgi:hypothetical protein